jgi:hypothetical protein
MRAPSADGLFGVELIGRSSPTVSASQRWRDSLPNHIGSRARGAGGFDGTPIGRIYADRLPSGEKWLWFLHILRATPNQGIADTLEDAKAALAESYRRHAGHMR